MAIGYYGTDALLHSVRDHAVIQPIICTYHNSWWLKKANVLVHDPSEYNATGPVMIVDQVTHPEPGSQILELTMLAVRKPTHALMNIVYPAYILSVLTCMSYLIGVGQGERVGLIITTQLAVIFINSLVEEQAAPAGDAKGPILCDFVQFVTCHCICALVETIVVLHFYSDGNCTLPSSLNIVVNELEEQTPTLETIDEKIVHALFQRLLGKLNALKQNELKTNRFYKFAKVLDWTSFALSLFITLTYITVMEYKMRSQYPMKDYDGPVDLKPLLFPAQSPTPNVDTNV